MSLCPENLQALSIDAVMDKLTASIVNKLPMDLQELIHRRTKFNRQKNLFYGNVIQWYAATSDIMSIGQYAPYYTIGEEYEYWPCGKLMTHGYWYKGKRYIFVFLKQKHKT